MPEVGSKITAAEAKALGLAPRVKQWVHCPDCGEYRWAEPNIWRGVHRRCERCRRKAQNPYNTIFNQHKK